jgi:hypothetical protein
MPMSSGQSNGVYAVGLPLGDWTGLLMVLEEASHRMPRELAAVARIADRLHDAIAEQVPDAS